MFIRKLAVLAAGIAAAASVALAGGGTALADTSCSTNCTNASLAVGNTIGTTGFPTSVALSGQAGSTASATATPYSVFSNTPWVLNWQDDTDDILASNSPGVWHVDSNPNDASFPISTTTSLGHHSGTFTLANGNGVQTVQIDSGGATAGGQNYADVYSVAIPAAQAPGQYAATFSYTLSAS